MNSRTFHLPADWEASHKVLSGHVAPLVKTMTMAGQKLECVVRPAKRSSEHSARLHATLAWISHNVPWAGEKRSTTMWKRLMTASWLRAKGEAVEVLPALDGHGIDVIYEHTSTMSGKQIAELLEYIYFWCAEQGHDLPEYTRGPDGQLVETYRNRKEITP